MRLLLAAALYTAMGTFANAADIETLGTLREGDMRKLRFHKSAKMVPDTAFTAENGEAITMGTYEGKVIVLNFWATWCAPCRKEMPHLSELQAEFGGDDFQVVTVATGVNQRPAMQRFLGEIGVDNLPLHTDGNSALARDMGVIGLPVTLILDPQGQEIARLIGDADWASDNAKEIVKTLIEGDA